MKIFYINKPFKETTKFSAPREQKRNGFTIVEMLVVIAVMAILLGTISIQYSAGKRQLLLNRAAYKLAKDIRRAQEMSLGAKQCCTSPKTVPDGGYGVSFTASSTSYQIKAYNGTGGAIATIEDIKIENGVELPSGAIIVDPPGTNVTDVNIKFLPPDPTTVINTVPYPSFSSVRITLLLSADHTKTKTVTINPIGMIAY